ncbi:MAG: hypothetical protein ACOYL5_18295, partial [Phototrophicaceae bacterium]
MAISIHLRFVRVIGGIIRPIAIATPLLRVDRNDTEHQDRDKYGYDCKFLEHAIAPCVVYLICTYHGLKVC